MLGTQDTLPGVGGPRLPHVVLLAPVLEQASGPKKYQLKCNISDTNRAQVGQEQSQVDPPGP